MNHISLPRRRVLSKLAAFSLAPAALTYANSAPAAVAGSQWTPDDLGERLWLDWRAADLAVGPVREWKDRAGGVLAVQAESAKLPYRSADGQVLFSGNGKGLAIPFQNKAHLAHRAVMMLFRADLVNAKWADGSLFHVNGADTGATSRQPAVLYQRASTQLRTAGNVSVEWRTPQSGNKATMTATGTFSDWHCLVSRRFNGKHYASIDGGAELEVGSDICLPAHNQRLTGWIGDIRASGSIEWALDTLLVLQDELSVEDAKRLAGWAMWKRGAQARLPANHAYRYAAPLRTAGATPVAYAETTTAEWTDIQQRWTTTAAGSPLESNFREALNLTGYRMVFEDHFNALSITDEVSGKGPWWTPVHPEATGKAVTAKGADVPRVFLQQGSELTIRMQNTEKGWMSGVMTSVNLNGDGHAWKYGYFEFRARSTRGNGVAAWPAIWLKSTNEFFRLTETRLELDLFEGYNSDPKGHHQSYHNWPAARLMPGRLAEHRYVSNYTGLKPSNWGQAVDLFDNQYHTYGVQIDETWVRFFFDNQELGRFPTPPEAKQELFILVDLALLPDEAAKAQGLYDLTLDYVRVYQR
jgi:hypothetical protein